MREIVITIIVIVFSAGLLKGGDKDSLYYTSNVFDRNIKTVQLYKEGWNLSYPVIKLNSTEKLVLQFDLLGNHNETYYYTFYHFDKDWGRSDIFINDYLEGFPENPIEDCVPSFNTTLNYFHYRLLFPNDSVNIKLSGNYVIIVYPADNPDKPVLIHRFIVTEDAAKIDIKMHRPLMTSDDNAGQQIDFTVYLTGLDIVDPYRNVHSFILQNGRWNNSKKNLKSDTFSGNELKYNSLSDKNIFNGGNEFRYFDIKSIKRLSEFVQRIDYLAPYYNILLKPSENREFKPYFYWQDFNGKYYIATEEGRNPDTDADYVNVYFTLPSRNKVDGGRMYVCGGLSNWALNEDNLMSFNQDKGQYECTLLLKQGWYNYEYVFLKTSEKEAIATKFEGSHYETENDYMVLVYYRNPRDRYDRVIGTAIANTLNHLTY